MAAEIVCGDVVEWAEEYDGPPFHALLCDPSYAMSKKKKIDLDAPANLSADATLKDVVEAYHSIQQWGNTGFMGKAWDNDVAFDPKTWRALARHLHPGAFGMAFASARNPHRMAVAIEDAGLVIHPTIFVWVQGQGFPKATRIDTQVDRRRGFKPGLVREISRYLREARKRKGISNKELADIFNFDARMAAHWCAEETDSQPVIPRLRYWPRLKEILDLDNHYDEAIEACEREVVGQYDGDAGGFGDYRMTGRDNLIRIPATELARVWEGHRYGLQAMKPAVEPIIVFQKPYEGRPVDCITETGAGALWVDGGRIGYQTNDDRPHYGAIGGGGWSGELKRAADFAGGPNQDVSHTQGRWPANFCLVHSPGCRRRMVEEPCPICKGRGIVATEPIAETFEEWYAKTKEYGGTREEYERLAQPGGSAFCRDCKDSGVVRRVGVRRVKGHKGYPHGPKGWGFHGGIGDRSSDGTRSDNPMPGHADAEGMEEVTDWECVAGCVCAKLGEQSGERKSGALTRSETARAEVGKHGIYGRFNGKPDGRHFPASEGTAARYFYQAGWEYECEEGCAVAKLDEQAGDCPGPGGFCDPNKPMSGMWSMPKRSASQYPGETGGPSRFYAQADWSHEIAEQLAQTDPVRYCPKAAKRERSNGLADFYWRKDKQAAIGFVRISKEEWEELGREEERIKQQTGKRVRLRAQGNIHPTQKPISLTKWLATLLLPPKEYAPRRILVPFAGKGSEAIGALLAGWEEAVAIELYQDYCDAMAARIDFWLDGRQLELL